MRLLNECSRGQQNAKTLTNKFIRHPALRSLPPINDLILTPRSSMLGVDMEYNVIVV
jgi:hypothetical protein